VVDVDFNLVLAEFQEFGPQRSVPIEERWRRRFPGASDEEVQAWAARCREVERCAWSIADRVLAGELSEAKGRKELARAFPDLDKDRVGRTFVQAMYFASK
jgi:hypothetical protein